MNRLFAGDIVEWLLPSPVYAFMFICIAVLLAFRNPVRPLFRRLRWLLIAVVVWSYAATTPAIVNSLMVRLESVYAPVTQLPEDSATENMIVVLSSGYAYERGSLDSYQLDLASMRRTVAAAELWRETGGKLIFVGSAYRAEPFPASARMAELAVSLGVAKDAIVVQAGSLNTRENMLHVKALMADHVNWILVTSASHMPRAMGAAKALGLRPLAYPCDFRGKRHTGIRAWLPNNRAFALMVNVLHEWFGYAYYLARGWI